LNGYDSYDIGGAVVGVHDQHPTPRPEDEAKVTPATFERCTEEREVREWFD
jgi:hypothetical protein